MSSGPSGPSAASGMAFCQYAAVCAVISLIITAPIAYIKVVAIEKLFSYLVDSILLQSFGNAVQTSKHVLSDFQPFGPVWVNFFCISAPD